MKILHPRTRKGLVPLALVAGVAGTLAVASQMKASDHEDTPLTELNPRLDINDVWVFPGSSDQRIVLAMTVASPLIGMNNTLRFDPNALYQLKVDNNQDGIEDVVVQFSFDDLANGTQTVDVMGPAAPRMDDNQFNAPFSSGGVRDRFLMGNPTIRRAALNSTATGGDMQVFAGVRDDPFYIDLDQFFRILPDRRPTEGPLSRIGAPGRSASEQTPFFTTASAFRARCDASGQFLANQAAFDQTRGCAKDFLAGVNALAIVVELPESQVMRSGNTGPLGVWGTISR